MSEYIGTPQRVDSITVADDSSPPQAGEINPGIEANRDQILWLEQKMGQSFAKFSARNFVPSDYSTAISGRSDARATALSATEDAFLIAQRNFSEENTVRICISRDGFGWALYISSAAPLAEAREIGAIAADRSVSPGYLILGWSGTLGTSSGQGQRIDVHGPDGPNTALRAGLFSATNYKAGCVLGSRAYLFGGVAGANGSPQAGAQPRVVTATRAGNFLDWTTAPGGTVFTGSNDFARNWVIAHGNGIVLAFVGNENTLPLKTYIRVDEVNNLVENIELPGTGLCNCNAVFWKGKFWAFVSEGFDLANVQIFSSANGRSWDLVATTTALGGAGAAFAEGDVIGFFTGRSTADQLDLQSLMVSFDGVEWSKMPVSCAQYTAAIVSTNYRTAVLRDRIASQKDKTDNLRISLGGLL